MSNVNFDDFFGLLASHISPPANSTRYRRGLIITSMLVTTILVGGLEFATVTAGGMAGLEVTRPLGMHVLAWLVFAYYMYAFHFVRQEIVSQLEIMKAQTLWSRFLEWLCRRRLEIDIEDAIGKSIANLPLSYSTDMEDVPEKAPGGICRIHVDFSPTLELKKKLLAHSSFAESDRHLDWLVHSYTVRESDIHEFDRRRAFALVSNRLVTLEYRVPYIGGWILLVTGIVLYSAWLLRPDSWLGSLVPLKPMITDATVASVVMGV